MCDEMSDQEVMDVGNAGTWVSTPAADMVVASGPAHSYVTGMGPQPSARLHHNQSVTHQTAVSSDDTAVIINTGVSEGAAEAVLRSEVGRFQVEADAR